MLQDINPLWYKVPNLGTRYQQQQAARANVQCTHHWETQFSVRLLGVSNLNASGLAHTH